ncbi:hypothetical protein Tco_0262182 [Tanacetum coccineum]
MLDSCTTLMCIESWGRSSFARCLIEINADDALKESLTMGVPLIQGTGFTIETVTIEYEWKQPRCDLCKIFGHVQDHCPKKMSITPTVVTSNVVTHTLNKLLGMSLTSAPKKRATNMSNVSKSSSMLKTSTTSTVQGEDDKKMRTSILHSRWIFSFEFKPLDVFGEVFGPMGGCHTPIRRRGLKERLGPKYVRSRFESPEPRRGRSESPKKKGSEKKAVFKRLEKGVFHRLGDKGKSVSVYSDDSRRRSYHSSHKDTESCHQSSRSSITEPASGRRYNKRASSRRTEELSESEGSAEGHWKSKVKRPKSSVEDDMSQPWRDGESTEEFVRRYKLECREVKGAPECMKISGFMHGITNPELIKRLHDKIPKSVDEMMRVTTAFLRGEVAASNRE